MNTVKIALQSQGSCCYAADSRKEVEVLIVHILIIIREI